MGILHMIDETYADPESNRYANDRTRTPLGVCLPGPSLSPASTRQHLPLSPTTRQILSVF
jgi:hypothetical protein